MMGSDLVVGASVTPTVQACFDYGLKSDRRRPGRVTEVRRMAGVLFAVVRGYDMPWRASELELELVRGAR